MATDADTQPTPPSPPTTPRRKLVRYPDRGHLGGVCEGLAEYLDLDATVVRFAAVVLACVGPGIPAYILAWIFVPEADGSSLAQHRGGHYRGPDGHGRHGHGNRFSQIVGIVLIGIAVSVLFGDWWGPARGWMLPLALIAFGGWLVLRPNDDDDELPLPASTGGWQPSGPTATSVAPAPPVPPAGATEADTAVASTTDDTTTDDTAVAPGGGDGGEPTWPFGHHVPPVPPLPPHRRRRRFLGPLVFGALLLWGGIAWLAGIEVEDGLAIGLCIIGAGFVIGAFTGGSRGLVFPALLIAAALIAMSVIDIPLKGGIGDRTWRIASLRDLDDEYELAIGDATLDLSDLRSSTGRVPLVQVSLGIGDLHVIVPEGATVDVKSHVGAGEIEVLGHRDEGMGVEIDRVVRGDLDGDRFELDLEVGLGHLEVVEAPR